MTDLVLFTIDKEYAEHMLNALNKDFYGGNNPYNAGEPFFDVVGDEALFYCPMSIPIMSKIVKKFVFKGFYESAKKSGIVIKRVKVRPKHKKRYEDWYDEQREKI